MTLQQLPDTLYAAWLRHRSLLGYLGLIALVTYATELTQFSLHMDSELHALDREAADDWIAQGRWGLYALNALLLPNTVMPVIPMLLAIIGLIIGSLFMLLAFSNQRGMADYIAAPIAVCCPVLYFALYYTTIGYGIGIAYAVSCAGFYAFTQQTRIGYITAALCFAFATGVYQAFLPLTVVLGGLWLAARIIDQRITSTQQALQATGLFIATVCVSMVVYVMTTKAVLAWTGTDYATAYLSGFVRYNFTASYIGASLQQSLVTLLQLYSGNSLFYLYSLPALGLLFVLSLACVIWHILCRAATLTLRALAILGLLAALLAPAALLMMNAGQMPPRVLFPAVTVIAGLVLIALQSQHSIVRIVITALALVSLYQFAVINNRFAFTNQMAWQADREFTTLIIARLDKLQQQLPADPARQRFPIEVVGTRQLPDIPVFEGPDLIGSSVLERTPAEITPRLTLVMRAMGNLDYRMARGEERLAVVDAAKQMPAWPHEDAVAVVNGVMVIKLGDYHPAQIPVQ